jgi:hypothetical protein
MQRLTGSDSGMAAFAPSVLAGLDAPATMTVLLDAAMKVMAQDQARSATRSETDTNWEQHSYVPVVPLLSAEARVESAPAEALSPAAPAAPAVPTPAAPDLPTDDKLPLPPALDLTKLLGLTDLAFMPALAVPVAAQAELQPAPGLDAAPSAQWDDVMASID